MSFGEKIASLMQKPGQDSLSKDDAPWWMKYGGRCLGTVAGFIAIFFAIFNFISLLMLNTSCFLSGMWQILAGFIIIMVEAPCCCMFIEFVQNVSDYADRKPYMHRGMIYCVMAVPPILLCIGAGSIIGSGLIFATGVVYIMMGKRTVTSDGLPTSTAASPQGIVQPSTDYHVNMGGDPDVWRPT